MLSRSVTQPEAVEVSLARPTIQQSLKDAMAIFSKSNTSVLPATTASRDALYRVSPFFLLISRRAIHAGAYRCAVH